MEPSPPKASRTRRVSSRPFYEASQKTSAEIVSEARSAVHSLNTKRPFTPLDSQRTLFCRTGEQRDGRPPSAVSVPATYIDSRPPTGRLTPIEQNEARWSSECKRYCSQCLDHSKLLAKNKKIECNGNIKTPPKKTIFKESVIPAPPEYIDPVLPNSKKRSSVQRRVASPKSESTPTRIQSGPKERTKLLDENLNELKRPSSVDDVHQRSQGSNLKKDQDLIYYEQNILPLLKQMELNALHKDTDALLVNFDVLWKTLEIGNMLGKSKLGSKRRTYILSTAYKSTANDDPLLLLKLCKLFIAMEVSGKNLEAVCKLMFKVSQNKKSDELFIKEKMIDYLLSLFLLADGLNITHCLVYLTGTIKFLSFNPTIMEHFIQHDTLKRIACLLMFTKDKVLATLNQFAAHKSQIEQFIEHNIIPLLLNLVTTRYNDLDYCVYLARIFNKLTVSEEMCKSLHEVLGNYEVIANVLKTNYKKQVIAVRICFSLGNLADAVIESRYYINKYGKDILIKTLHHYLQPALNAGSKRDRLKATDAEDVIIKAIRVFANLSVDSDCGLAFADNDTLLKYILCLLEKSDACSLSFEVVTTAAACLNNLSYYVTATSYIYKRQEELTRAMIPILISESMECILEVVRVFGNLTQSRVVRDLLVDNKAFDILITLLDSNNSELIFAICGVLINLMVDKENRRWLKEYNGIQKLIECLKDLGEHDWQLAGMICQIFWNYSEQITTSVEYFGEEQVDDIITVLCEFLDPDLAIDYEENTTLTPEDVEKLIDSWQEHFHPVASLLLQHVEMHHTDLEPLAQEPD